MLIDQGRKLAPIPKNIGMMIFALGVANQLFILWLNVTPMINSFLAQSDAAIERAVALLLRLVQAASKRDPGN